MPPDLSERIAKMEAVFPTLATKEDLAREIGGLRAEMHREFTAQSWRLMGFTAAMVALVYGIARYVH